MLGTDYNKNICFSRGKYNVITTNYQGLETDVGKGEVFLYSLQFRGRGGQCKYCFAAFFLAEKNPPTC